MSAHRAPASRLRTLGTVAAVTIAAVLLAAWWALRVPLFQRPDEWAHADYAFTLVDVGHPFRVARAVPSDVPVAAQVRYLEEAAGYRSMRYNPFARAPQGYGDPEFVARLDRAAPRDARLQPARGAAMPYAMFAYPAGYYTLVAGVMSALERLGATLWWTFVGARLFNAALLLATLPLAFATLREYRVAERTALAATAAIGFLPLTQWVAGYVQPDNLSLLLVTLAVYAAARVRRRGIGARDASVLVAAIVALLFTKQHYGVAVWLPALALVATRIGRRPAPRDLAAVAALALLPALALAFSFAATPVAGVRAVASTIAQATGPGAAELGAWALRGYADEFGGGAGFSAYWFYDLRGLRVLGVRVEPALTPPFVLATVATSIAFALALYATLRRIVAAARRRRSPALALRLVASGMAVNTYLAVTAIVLAAYAAERGELWLEGRYWLPAAVPLAVLLTTAIPRLARARARPAFALALASAPLAASLATTPLMLFAMQQNFYGPPGAGPRVNRLASVALTRATERELTFDGFAVDTISGLPAARVELAADGKPLQVAATGLPRPEVARAYNDGALGPSGFRIVLRRARLRPGRHQVTFAVLAANGRRLPIPAQFDVEEPVPVGAARPSSRRAASSAHSRTIVTCANCRRLARK